ncbi:MAG: Rpn family recombination-promoting nuclease/putative transposase [Chitinispirillales bacterium]|jgi:predicted transposase/invertase (TIGR01784 family)|nr:Rpn family recombination-promoting nuclease/putative transposase [Chitinispirillales bacterium]
MPKYLDPKNDLMFKKVFGEHKHLCISLLNSLLKFEGDRVIESIEYESNEMLPDLPAFDKYGIVDVRCKDKAGRQFIVEMQMHWTTWFQMRVLFNASKAYVRQVKKGASYELAQPVYLLSLVNDVFEKDAAMKEVFYHHYKIVNIENTEKRIKGLEFVFVELPKYKPCGKKEQDYFDLWLRYFTEIHTETDKIPADLLENKELSEAVECVLESSLTPEERDTYDAILDAQMTQHALIEGSKYDAKQEGIAEGEIKGRAEGETKRAAEIALKLKESGMTNEQIYKITGVKI